MSAVISPAPASLSSPWRASGLALAVVLLLLGLLYADTVTTMVGIWSRSETFAHAWLVLPITLWLVWRQRDALAQMVPRPQPWLLLGLIVAASAWLLADLVQVNSASQLAWMTMVVLAVPAVLGLQVALAILFPLLFLFFAVPVGEFMLPMMMDWTADFTVAALRLSGIPVYREGLQFVIPSGNWSVVEACSGVRYLIASFMVGTLFAYLNYRSWQRRLVFILVSIAVPIVANWLRAYMIVMLGHLSGNTIAVGADHLIYGWVFFGFVIMIMFAIGARWSEPDAEVAPLSAVKASQLNNERGDWRARPLVVATLLTAGLLAAPHGALWALQQAERGAVEPALALPGQLAPGWQDRGAGTGTGYQPHFVNPSATAQRSYAGAAGEVGVYLAYYRGQGPERKLVSSVNTLVRSKDKTWNRVASGTHSVQAADRQLTWRTARVLATDATAAHRAQLVVWQVYWIDGRWVAGDIGAKVAGAFARLQGHGDDGAALVLHTDSSDPARGRALLETFVRENLGQLESLLQATRDKR
jgi:exosortase A